MTLYLLLVDCSSPRANRRDDRDLVAFLYHHVFCLPITSFIFRHVHISQVYRDQTVVQHACPNPLVPLLERGKELPQRERRRQRLDILGCVRAGAGKVQNVEVAW